MYKFVFKLLKVSTAVFTATFLLAVNSPVRAESKTESKLPEAQPGVEVLRTDWSYQTLQALAKKYDCLPADNVLFTTKSDYVSRQVFTTNLSTCLQSMEELVARRTTRRRPTVRIRRRVVAPVTPVAPVAPVEPVAPAPVAPVEPTPVEPPAPPVVEIQEEPAEAITQQDLDNIKALVAAFDSELAALEKRITSKSFSTTTKLVGEVIINFGGYGGVPSNAGRLDSNTYLGNRVRLNFDTSFTGKDRLRTRLQSRNIPSLATPTGTNMTRLGIDGSENNDDYLGLLQYDFSLTDSTRVRIGATGYRFNDNQPVLNPQLASSANGAISRFGRFNPIFRLAGDGTAITVAQKFSNELSLDVGYAVPANGLNPATPSNASVVTPSNGFFQGQNAILTQLTYTPSKEFSVAALYGRTYNNAGGLLGSTGSAAANNPFSTTAISSNIISPTTNPSGAGKPAALSTLAATTNQNTTANHYSFLASYKLGDSAVISGWAGFVEANQAQASGGGSASISNYAISLAFPNFGAEGNMLGFVFGIPPKLNSRTVTIGGATNTTTGNPDTSYHLEALYKVRLNDNIDITPGLLLITNPEHNSANPTEYVGTLRTTFRF
jgi:Carbohydrate-selective porin, OprB family